MAKFIEDIHNLHAFLTGKNIATAQPPERIDLVLHEITNSIFNDHYDHYVKTQKISDYLTPFMRSKELTLSSGKIEVPLNYEHHRLTTLPDGTLVDMVFDKFWSGRVKSKLNPPSALSPICRIEMDDTVDPAKRILEVLPANTAKVMFYYFKTPTRAKYAYTKPGLRYLYDEANSIDSDFRTPLFPQIALKLLSRFGINLREQQVISYAEQMKATEDRK